jgi:hypothetical protein
VILLIHLSTMPDSLVMAPFAVGDYIDYSGINVGGTIVCWSIVANILISSTNPGYIRMEDALVGVIDADPNVEFSQSKVCSPRSILLCPSND